MSSTETVIGKLRKLEFAEALSIEEKAKRVLLSEYPSEDLDGYGSYEELMRDNYDEDFLIIGDDIYSLSIIEWSDGGEDIFHAKKDKETGEIDFVCQYYNGGCCLSEALEEAIKGMK